MMMSFGMASPKAFKRMIQLIDYAKSEHVQLEASKEVLNRAGFVEPKRDMHITSRAVSIHIDLG